MIPASLSFLLLILTRVRSYRSIVIFEFLRSDGTFTLPARHSFSAVPGRSPKDEAWTAGC